MSKTDKDKPFWVQNLDNPIEHNHEHGRCVISDDRRDRWSGWGPRHRRRCNKNVVVEFTCTKDEPYRGRGRWHERTCWILRQVCECPIPASWKRESHGCTGRFRPLGCIGHTRTEYHTEIPCVCDDRPEPATCFPEWNSTWHSFCYGGVPHWFVREVWHSPERARERETLGRIRREWNEYGDVEDDDFANYQGRNSARWLWW